MKQKQHAIEDTCGSSLISCWPDACSGTSQSTTRPFICSRYRSDAIVAICADKEAAIAGVQTSSGVSVVCSSAHTTASPGPSLIMDTSPSGRNLVSVIATLGPCIGCPTSLPNKEAAAALCCRGISSAKH